MYFKRIVIENIKGFPGRHDFDFARGLNYLVGDNNCGKSTLFEALLYLVSGKPTGGDFKSVGVEQPIRIEAVLAGADLRALVDDAKFVKYAEYLHDDGGEDAFRVERMDANRTVVQGAGKPVNLSAKTACFWHPARKQFENPTGIDALFRALVDLQPIWADEDPADVTDFSTTKTLGRLVDAAAQPFFGTPAWSAFLDAHNMTFGGSGEESLVGHAASIASDLQQLVDEQYGTTRVRLGFEVPAPAAFVKMGQILVDDGAGETDLASKGTGMQRAFALAVIQLYARSRVAEAGAAERHVLLVDEPETWLHPSAQLRLGQALAQVALSQQVFLITHSPYLIRTFDSGSHQLTVFRGRGPEREIAVSRLMGIGGSGSPTWGEITYRAFGIASREFHDELYGLAQNKCGAALGLDSDDSAKEKQVDDWLATTGLARSHQWTRPGWQPYNVTLPVFVRNLIHHPENALNGKLSEEDLARSTTELLSVVM